MRTFIKLALYFISLMLIHSCSHETNGENEIVNETTINPLDSILGDKLLDEGSGKIRIDNFSDFLQLTEDDLSNESNLYDVHALGTDFYFLNQNKYYSEARLFSALLKVGQENVVNYQVFNDFGIRDKSIDSKGVFILLGNFGAYNKFWKTESEIQLIKFDSDLNQIWTYAPNSDHFPLEAKAITCQNDYVNVVVNVITGCHICYNVFELKIDNQGKCFSAIQVDRHNSSVVLTEETIHKIFKSPMSKPKNH